jgi:hypothetical protein
MGTVSELPLRTLCSPGVIECEREREGESNYVWPKMCTRHFKEFLHAPSTRGRPSAAPTQTPRAGQPGREGRERTHEGRAELLARRELEETN